MDATEITMTTVFTPEEWGDDWRFQMEQIWTQFVDWHLTSTNERDN